MRRATIAAGVVALLALAGCSNAAAENEPLVAGSLAVVEAYVDAIGAGDLETATALTDPEALVAPEGRQPVVDVTAALPDAIEPMRDPWIALLGTGWTYVDPDGSSETTDLVSFEVSYLVGGYAGSATVEVMRVGEDAAQADSWIVTAGLLEERSIAEDDGIGATTLGGVDLGTGPGSVWGYPGVYEHAAVSVPEGVSIPPVEVHVGADVGSRWDSGWPRLRLERS